MSVVSPKRMRVSGVLVPEPRSVIHFSPKNQGSLLRNFKMHPRFTDIHITCRCPKTWKNVHLKERAPYESAKNLWSGNPTINHWAKWSNLSSILSDMLLCWGGHLYFERLPELPRLRNRKKINATFEVYTMISAKCSRSLQLRCNISQDAQDCPSYLIYPCKLTQISPV